VGRTSERLLTQVGDEDCEQGLGLLGLTVGDDVLELVGDGVVVVSAAISSARA